MKQLSALLSTLALTACIQLPPDRTFNLGLLASDRIVAIDGYCNTRGWNYHFSITDPARVRSIVEVFQGVSSGWKEPGIQVTSIGREMTLRLMDSASNASAPFGMNSDYREIDYGPGFRLLSTDERQKFLNVLGNCFGNPMEAIAGRKR